MTNFILRTLLICSITAVIFSLYTDAQYYKHRAESAEAVIKVVEEYNYDFTVDVLYETDEYATWEESK